jgi:hypothetical protein
MPRRVSPHIYATVFAMPDAARVATRGGAAVPTLGHWADPPPRSFGVMLRARNPAAAAADEECEIKLMEARVSRAR